MDRVVKVRRSFLNDIRAFLNVFASMCIGCFRGTCDCQLANEIRRAKALIFMIDNVRDAEEERYFVENPAEELYAKIVEAVRQAGGKPVRSQDIRIPGINRQRKSRAMKTLVRRGNLVRIIEGEEAFYTVCEDQSNRKQKTQKENQNGI